MKASVQDWSDGIGAMRTFDAESGDTLVDGVEGIFCKDMSE